MATIVNPKDYFSKQFQPNATNNQLGLTYFPIDQSAVLTNNIILIAIIAGIALGISITLALSRGK